MPGRFFALMVMLFAPALSPALASAEHYEVFLVSGQSNCDGRGQVSKLVGDLAKWAEPRADILINYSCADFRGPILATGGFKPLRPGYSVKPGNRPTTLPSDTFGPEVSFGATLVEKMPGKHIALIKYAEGGTSLKKDWNPEIRNRLYDNMIAHARKSLKELEAGGNTWTIRGMIWHQGESDEGLQSTEEYTAMLAAFVAKTRKDLSVPEMPFVLGELYDNGKREKIRAAHRAAETAIPHAALVSCKGLETSDRGTHFDAPSQIEFGKRYAETMLKMIGQ